MGFGEWLVIQSTYTISRFAKKVVEKVFYLYPAAGFRALFGDSGDEGALACFLRDRTHVLVRMIDVTYDIAKHGSNGANRSVSQASPEIKASLNHLRDLGFERMSAEALFPSSKQNEIEMTEYDLNDVRELLEGPRCHVTVFRRRLRGDQSEFVVSIRGTRFTSLLDWMDDFQIACERLHGGKRVEDIYKLVTKLVEWYGRESVILTGHSLGASVGFHVARKLYLKKTEVEGHFFELPFVTWDKILEKALLFFQVEIACLKIVVDALRLNRLKEKLLGILAKQSARLLSFDFQKAERKFDALQDWHPFIYVQKYDEISNEYINFFNNSSTVTGGLGISGSTSILNTLQLNARARHLCPSAYLITSNKGVGTLTSHGIIHWKDVERIRVQATKYTNLCPVGEIK